MALGDVQQLVDDMVRDDAGLLGASARDDAIRHAVFAYSVSRPRILVEDLVADGSAMLPLPAEWAGGTSRALRIESPIGTDLPHHVWCHVRLPEASGGGVGIRLLTSISAGREVRIEYRTPHRVDETNDTVSASDRQTVASYAAYLLLDQLANRHAGDSDSTIQSDSVNHQNKSRDYAARARVALERYHRLTDASRGASRPATAMSISTVPTVGDAHACFMAEDGDERSGFQYRD